MTGEITTALKRWREGGHLHAVVFGTEQITRWRTQDKVVDGSDTYEVPTGGWTQVETIDNPSTSCRSCRWSTARGCWPRTARPR